MQGLNIFTSHFSFAKGLKDCASPICGRKSRKREIMDINGNTFDTGEKKGISRTLMEDASCKPIQTEAD